MDNVRIGAIGRHGKVAFVSTFVLGDLSFIGPYKFLAEVMRKLTGSLLCHDRKQITVKLPVFELIQ